MPEKNYSRKYPRITPDYPLYAEIALVKVGCNTVHTGTARVRIINISQGGLKFISSLKLPVTRSVILEIYFKIMEQSFRLNGFITYKNCEEICEFEYGFSFLQQNETLKLCLIKLFNDISKRMNQHIVIFKLN